MKQKEIYDLMRECNIKMIQSDKWRPMVFFGGNGYDAVYFFSDRNRLSARLLDSFGTDITPEYVWSQRQTESDIYIDEKDFLIWIFVAKEIKK